MLKLTLRDKIAGLLICYFLVALVAIGSTLFVSWRLEGGAAAINDAGRERMRSYRIAFLLAQQIQQSSTESRHDVEQEIRLFENTLIELEHGNPQRPLFLPKDTVVRRQMTQLREDWREEIKPRLMHILQTADKAEQGRLLGEYRQPLQHFVAGINDLVAMVEHSNARATGLLRSLQIALVSLALIGTILLIHFFSLLVVQPVTRLREGLRRMGQADFGVRLPPGNQDEFGDLTEGFNKMAEQLQDIYATLEQRVADKTRGIDLKNRELAALYEVAAFLNSSAAAEPLCAHILGQMVRLIGARGGVVRLVDPQGEQLHVVAAHGVSESFLEQEAYLAVGSCLCGKVASDGISVSADFSVPSSQPLLSACKKDGFQAVAAVPIRSKQRDIGMLNLFFDTPRILPPTEVRLLESVALHLGIAIENQRLVAREKEMAVSEERNLLAQELHDSIAQSLALLNIQVQLLQDDLRQEKLGEANQIVAQIRESVQESYDDVRELLVHFRTRIGHTDMESAIRHALERFKGQVGIRTQYSRLGPNPEIDPEHILQVLHILQESLSNARKHSQATLIDVVLENKGECRLSISDNGLGFEVARDAGDSHVGIHIMRERAQRIGGQLAIESAPGKGTAVTLSWMETTEN